MWRCKCCGKEVVLIEIDEIKTKYNLNKDKTQNIKIGSCNSKPRYIFECKICGNKSYNLEDIAVWEDDNE